MCAHRRHICSHWFEHQEAGTTMAIIQRYCYNNKNQCQHQRILASGISSRRWHVCPKTISTPQRIGVVCAPVQVRRSPCVATCWGTLLQVSPWMNSLLRSSIDNCLTFWRAVLALSPVTKGLFTVGGGLAVLFGIAADALFVIVARRRETNEHQWI